MSFHNCLIIRNYSKSFSINFNFRLNFCRYGKEKKINSKIILLGLPEEILTECKNININIYKRKTTRDLLTNCTLKIYAPLKIQSSVFRFPEKIKFAVPKSVQSPSSSRRLHAGATSMI